MKASDLIKELAALIADHGDLPVEYADQMPADSGHRNVIVEDVGAFDDSGGYKGEITFFRII